MNWIYILIAYWVVAVIVARLIFTGDINPINGRKFSTMEGLIFILIFMPLALPFALIYGACSMCYKTIKKLRYRNRPQPMPKKLRRFLKPDTVFDENNASMSLAKYNKTHGTNFTLDEVYGKGYEASMTYRGEKYVPSASWSEEDEVPF